MHLCLSSEAAVPTELFPRAPGPDPLRYCSTNIAWLQTDGQTERRRRDRETKEKFLSMTNVTKLSVKVLIQQRKRRKQVSIEVKDNNRTI